MAEVFLGIPTYNGWMHRGCAAAAYGMPSTKHAVVTQPWGGSMLNGNCNRLLSIALSGRDRFTWYAQLHADISPDFGFIDKLIDEAESHNADMMSAVIAIKNSLGVTSTAICSGRRYGQFGRLAFAQLRHPSFPQTFDIHSAADALESLPAPLGATVPRTALLANTGCMVVRLDRPWSHKLLFRSFDTIVQRESGEFVNCDLSEDWYFSWRLARLGGKVMCTQVVAAKHAGEAEFPNDRDWPNGIANEMGVSGDRTAEIHTLARTGARG